MGLIFQIIRLQQILQLKSEQYPHISTEQFNRWRALELKSAYIFLLSLLVLGAGWGIAFLFLQVEASVPVNAPPSQQNVSPIIPLGMEGGIVLFFIGLVVSAIFGSQAAKLRKTLQIKL